MPVPLAAGTATSVVSADTNVVVRLGIEGQSVRAACGVVKRRTVNRA